VSKTKQPKSPATPQAAWRAVNQVVEARLDPIGMATPLIHAQLAWLSHPEEMSEALTGFSTKLWELQVHSWRRALGMQSKDVIAPNPGDTRFADPVWSESASWDIVKEWYLMMTHQVQDMLYDTPGLSNRDRRRAAFWWRKWLNAVAPTNFLLTNIGKIPFHIRKLGQLLNAERRPLTTILKFFDNGGRRSDNLRINRT